ncbi:hypothetical protein FJT64_023151 [Amphibalanus amphitrite]|uniref:Uncharacterized protein n=1 Tax=Amphibalanus amphitrite TaxID=1232801 RepID=A0A6A4WCX1_AMPAM|nr:hypothetical protein FJT64_023151 [Amphibalanus amphitrite]
MKKTFGLSCHSTLIYHPLFSDGPETAALRRPPPGAAGLCAAAVSASACDRLAEWGRAALTAGRCRPSLETALLCGQPADGDTLLRLLDCCVTDLSRWFGDGLPLRPLLPLAASRAWSAGRVPEAAAASALCRRRQESVSGDPLVRRWCQLLASRGALVQLCLQRAVLTDAQQSALVQFRLQRLGRVQW